MVELCPLRSLCAWYMNQERRSVGRFFILFHCKQIVQFGPCIRPGQIFTFKFSVYIWFSLVQTLLRAIVDLALVNFSKPKRTEKHTHNCHIAFGRLEFSTAHRHLHDSSVSYFVAISTIAICPLFFLVFFFARFHAEQFRNVSGLTSTSNVQRENFRTSITAQSIIIWRTLFARKSHYMFGTLRLFFLQWIKSKHKIRWETCVLRMSSSTMNSKIISCIILLFDDSNGKASERSR